jgi:hypothetical protein
VGNHGDHHGRRSPLKSTFLLSQPEFRWSEN